MLYLPSGSPKLFKPAYRNVCTYMIYQTLTLTVVVSALLTLTVLNSVLIAVTAMVCLQGREISSVKWGTADCGETCRPASSGLSERLQEGSVVPQ